MEEDESGTRHRVRSERLRSSAPKSGYEPRQPAPSCYGVNIYVLIDPRTSEVRYVGKTIQAPKRRLSEHISRAQSGEPETHVYRWIRKVLREGLEPRIVVLEVATDDWQEREKLAIRRLREIGFRLTNQLEGGELDWTGRKHSEETKRKISASMSGRKLSEGHKRKISESGTGRAGPMAGMRHTDEAKRKMSDAHKGKKKSAETRQRMREAALRRWAS